MDKQQMKAIVVKYREYLPETAKTLFDALGFEGLCELSSLYGGDNLYIQKQETMFSGCMQRSLIDEFNGSNLRDLSAKYGVCTRTVYKLLSKHMKEKMNGRVS